MPKYSRGDIVEFGYLMFNKVGVIQVVDTFPDSATTYYDILVESEPTLYKHISEEHIFGLFKSN